MIQKSDAPIVEAARGLIPRLRSTMGLDAAVLSTVFARVWQIGAGLVTLVLVARSLSPVQQGYFYTFNSVVALQVFFELGLAYVVMQVASHERSQLVLEAAGRVEGPARARARLASLLHAAVRYYGIIAIAAFVILLPAGLWFFAGESTSVVVRWRLPWLAVVSFTVITLLVNAVLSFLEGCGFVADVARMRLAQGILGSTLLWSTLLVGGGLFASAANLAGIAIFGVLWVRGRFGTMLTSIHRGYDPAERLDWRTEVWPFQWRIAVSWLAGYFIFQIFNPILFAYHGPTAAGQMGMTISIVNAVGAVALAWVNTKAPTFGVLVARRDYATLDPLFLRTLLQSLAVLVLGAATVFAGVVYLNAAGQPAANRVLPPLAFGMLLAAVIVNHIVFAEALYLRAHKQEPFLVMSVAGGIVNAISAFVLGRRYGPTGMAAGYLSLSVLVGLTFGTATFLRKRRLWRSDLAA